MTDGAGWRDLPKQGLKDRIKSSANDGNSSFQKLAKVHGAQALGDGAVLVALADSVFFSISPDAARVRVILLLLLTLAPFAIVGPLIGPAIDRMRGGRRMNIIVIALLRTVAALVMIRAVDSLLLFPVAFGYLVLGKSYVIAKAAIVPSTTRSADELVDRNSRLALLSKVSIAIGGGSAALAIGFVSLFTERVQWPALVIAVAAFVITTIFAFQLPKTAVAPDQAKADEKQELRGRGILLGASAMGIIQAIIGCFTWLSAFAFREAIEKRDFDQIGAKLGTWVQEVLLQRDFAEATAGLPWRMGVVLGSLALGALIGTLLAPRLRKSTSEETMLLGGLILVVAAGFLAIWGGGVQGGMVLGLGVGVTRDAGRLAFDSLVQRDAPDANYGRSFGRFETRFQLMNVIGGIIPVALNLPARAGFLIITIAAAIGAITYYLGQRAASAPPAPSRVTPPAQQPLGHQDPKDPTVPIYADDTGELPIDEQPTIQMRLDGSDDATTQMALFDEQKPK